MVTSVNERIAKNGETGESRSRVYSLFRQRKRLRDPRLEGREGGTYAATAVLDRTSQSASRDLTR